MNKLIMAIVLSIIPASTYADIITFDYTNGSAPVPYMIPYYTDSNHSLPDPLAVLVVDLGVDVQAFQDSGVTFLNSELITSPYASDGHAMSSILNATQYGTLGILFPSPVDYVAIQFVEPFIFSLSALNYTGGGYVDSGGSISGNSGSSTAALDISSTAGFNFLRVVTYGDLIDTISYNYMGLSGPGVAVPEPSTLLLIGSGLMGLGLVRLFKKS